MSEAEQTQNTTITVDRHAIAQSVKIMTAAHHNGFFSKFTPDEAMKHLSVIVYLQNLLKDGS